MLKPADVIVTSNTEHGGFNVTPIWADVDRPNVGGWLVVNEKHAARLKAALLDGVVFSRTEIKADVNGESYVATTSLVMGKCLNSDLKKLGY